MDSDKSSSSRRLPFMCNFDDAERVARERKDPFYFVAFLLQFWLGELLARAAGQYAERKNPRDRSLQSGEGWRALTTLFKLKPDGPCSALLGCFYRFSVEDNSSGNSLRHALACLIIEHRCTGDYFGPKTMKEFTEQLDPDPPAFDPQLSTLTRRTLMRWCDWLDSEIHLRTHRRWHESPASFDPDPETRYLAALGTAQRRLASLDLHGQASWVMDLATAARHFKDSPKWAALGKAMADSSDRVWLYPEVDTLVIGLWPLVKAYNWTYRDLLNVIRPMLKRPGEYPCSGEHEFAPYCLNVLGLRKACKGRSAKDGRPKGCEVVRELCPAVKGRR